MTALNETPIEQAAAKFAAAQAEVERLERLLHQLDRERAAARTTGDNVLHAELNQRVSETNVALRLARGAVEQARGRVDQSRQELSRARSAVASLSNEEARLSREVVEAQERAQALAYEHTRVQERLVEARLALAALEPIEQLQASTPAKPVTPEPRPEQPPPQPHRSVYARGFAPQHFDKDNRPTDSQGQPLPGTAAQKAEPKLKSEPQVQSAPSLWD